MKSLLGLFKKSTPDKTDQPDEYPVMFAKNMKVIISSDEMEMQRLQKTCGYYSSIRMRPILGQTGQVLHSFPKYIRVSTNGSHYDLHPLLLTPFNQSLPQNPTNFSMDPSNPSDQPPKSYQPNVSMQDPDSISIGLQSVPKDSFPIQYSRSQIIEKVQHPSIHNSPQSLLHLQSPPVDDLGDLDTDSPVLLHNVSYCSCCKRGTPNLQFDCGHNFCHECVDGKSICQVNGCEKITSNKLGIGPHRH